MSIRKSAVYSDCISGQDYAMKFTNHTNKNIIVADSAGRVVTHKPAFLGSLERRKAEFIITEWYRGAQHAAELADLEKIEVPLTPSNELDLRGHIPEQKYSGVTLCHGVSLELLAENPDGIYLEEMDIWICLEEHMKEPRHPRFDGELRAQINQIHGLGFAIEVLDPNKCMDTFYTNIGGAVMTVIPVRVPTPHQEGVVIHIRDPIRGHMEKYHYPVEELLSGPGKHGIRLYSNKMMAQIDPNRPEILELEKDRMKFEAEKKKLEDDAYQNGRRETLEEANKILASSNDKLRRAEEHALRAHETRQKEKTGIVANFLKLVQSFVGLIRGVFSL